MPVVDPQTPTLCLVGAPNVGKSSLVRILSTGKPEVNVFLQNTMGSDRLCMCLYLYPASFTIMNVEGYILSFIQLMFCTFEK